MDDAGRVRNAARKTRLAATFPTIQICYPWGRLWLSDPWSQICRGPALGAPANALRQALRPWWQRDTQYHLDPPVFRDRPGRAPGNPENLNRSGAANGR